MQRPNSYIDKEKFLNTETFNKETLLHSEKIIDIIYILLDSQISLLIWFFFSFFCNSIGLFCQILQYIVNRC